MKHSICIAVLGILALLPGCKNEPSCAHVPRVIDCSQGVCQCIQAFEFCEANEGAVCCKPGSWESIPLGVCSGGVCDTESCLGSN